MARIKICGLQSLQDIDAVNQALPEYVGFVFAESRRRIDERAAAKLRERLDSRIKAVGVFVDQSPDFIASLHRQGIIDIVQLHGDEGLPCASLLKERCGCKVIKAIGLSKAMPLGAAAACWSEAADHLLFDTAYTEARAARQRGGLGEAFDWGVLKGYCGPPYFLAGGLTLSNVALAIESLAPYCVDVSSGVETEGKKDADKILEFVQVARSIGARKADE